MYWNFQICISAPFKIKHNFFKNSFFDPNLQNENSFYISKKKIAIHKAKFL